LGPSVSGAPSGPGLNGAPSLGASSQPRGFFLVFFLPAHLQVRIPHPFLPFQNPHRTPPIPRRRRSSALPRSSSLPDPPCAARPTLAPSSLPRHRPAPIRSAEGPYPPRTRRGPPAPRSPATLAPLTPGMVPILCLCARARSLIALYHRLLLYSPIPARVRLH
jgi:hypothetical protein